MIFEIISLNEACFFSTYTFFAAIAAFCWKHYKNSAFSSRTQLLKNTISNNHFFTHPKNTFSKKGVVFGFAQFP